MAQYSGVCNGIVRCSAVWYGKEDHAKQRRILGYMNYGSAQEVSHVRLAHWLVVKEGATVRAYRW